MSHYGFPVNSIDSVYSVSSNDMETSIYKRYCSCLEGDNPFPFMVPEWMCDSIDIPIQHN